jgi:hypothetical protein
MNLGKVTSDLNTAEEVARDAAEFLKCPVWLVACMDDERGEEVRVRYSVTTERPGDTDCNYYRYDPDGTRTLEGEV